MRTLCDTTEILIERWLDPGDYPNAVTQSPLPSYVCVAGIEGEVGVELTWREFRKFVDIGKCESVEFWMIEILDYVYPDGVCSAKWEWEAFGGERCGFLWLRRKTVTVTLCAGDVEVDPNYRGPEPDFG